MSGTSSLPLFPVVALIAGAASAQPRHPFAVSSMPTVVFTGDSQSCGRNLAIDFPQLVSRSLPVRVINTAVGGSNSSALLYPMKGGTVRVTRGEKVLHGENVRWGTGPFPGMKVTVAGETYTIDHIDEHPPTRNAELYLCEPARADYHGADCVVEPGWEVRVASHKPAVVCLMFINDGALPATKQDDWREMVRRTRELGAVPVLMSPVAVDDSAAGGGHPGDNRKVLKNARAVAALAASERCWFVDVTNLYFALDPGFRGVVHDGIHPDTDGSTLIVNGLQWVFAQMGLTDARPFVRGWRLSPTDTTMEGGADDCRSVPRAPNHESAAFRTAQPDHPDPDHQETAGFSLAAIRRNDDYGLIAELDGEGVPLGGGLMFRCGLPRGAAPTSVNVRLATMAATLVQVWFWLPGENRWSEASISTEGDWRAAALPAAALQGGEFAVRISGSVGGALDALAGGDAGGALGRWHPSEAEPSAYRLTSDHSRTDNLVRNADFAAGSIGMADGWKLTGGAAPNRPFRRQVRSVAFIDERDLRLMELKGAEGAREFDLLEVAGSAESNDGAYRILHLVGDGRVRVRKRAKAAETGLQAEWVHDDGCGLVPGGCCLEVAGEGAAKTTVALPGNVSRIQVSLFYRVFDPSRLGTRDVPDREARLSFLFRDSAGAQLGAPWEVADLTCSYQWQKAEMSHAVPTGSRTVDLVLRSGSATAVQYTGTYVAAQP